MNGHQGGYAAGSFVPAEPAAPPADQASDRSRAGRGDARRGRASATCLPPCRSCCVTSRALPLDEAARQLRLSGRHAPQPNGPRPREARVRTDCAAASSCPRPCWRRSWRPGPPRRPSHRSCANPRPGPRSASRRHTAAAGGALSAPAAALAQEVLRSMLIHKLETRRTVPVAPGRRRRRRRVPHPLAGDEG